MRIQLIRSAGRMRSFGIALPALLRPADDDNLPALWRARLGAWSAMLLHDSGQVEEGALLALQALDWAAASADSLSVASARHAASICCGAPSRPPSTKSPPPPPTPPAPHPLDL